jgi:DNA-binding Lrp family transcriptional regulator
MSRYELDSIDNEMLSMLRGDGRVAFTTVAAQVGLSPDAVRARYTRLVTDGVVRVIGLVHPRSLGFERRATVWLSYRGDTEQLAKVTRDLPNIAFMTEMVGGRNVLVEVVGRDDAEVADVIAATFRQLPEATGIEVSTMLEVVKWQTQARRGSAVAAEPATNLGETDTALLRLLIENPRANYRELADRLGEPYWWVRKRTQALFAEGTVSVAVMVDRLSTEARVMASVELRLAGPHADDAVRAMAALDEVALLTLTTGETDVVGEVTCTDDAALADLVRRIRSLPGVSDTRVRPYVRTLVLPMPWSLDPDPAWA